MPPSIPAANVVNLMTPEGVATFTAQWKNMDVKIDTPKCPECGNEFKYIAFQNIKDHMPKMLRVVQERPNIIFVDYDDFKKIEGEEKAKDIFR